MATGTVKWFSDQKGFGFSLLDTFGAKGNDIPSLSTIRSSFY